MCGITGIAQFGDQPAVDPRVIDTMVATLVHRGPDDVGMDSRDGVSLGMRRLAVIDIAGGKQPFFSEDRSVRVIFNGEIYNHRELRHHLESKGHIFSSLSDTEVLVHAYEEYGSDFPKHLNGMFAIALHDSARSRLILVRDPIGIKPLYYCFKEGQLIWGSEIKAVLASGLAKRGLDMNALGEFLAWEYVPGSATLYKSIKKLKPGTLLEVDLRDPVERPRTYWTLSQNSEPRTNSDAKWEDLINHQFRESVQAQMGSDVPLGALLSGGVDSSLIVSAMGPAETFSIGFQDSSYNELPWAERVADHLGVSNKQEVLQAEVVDLFDLLLEFLDDPIGDFSIFPTYLVSRLARRDVTVVLSGDGGDEVFGGYETYAAQLLARKYAHLPRLIRKGVIEPLALSLKPRRTKKGWINKSRRFAEGLSYPPELGHARWRQFAGEARLNWLLTPDANDLRTRRADEHITTLLSETGDFSPVQKCLYVDLKSYLCDNILTKVDRMSMAVSLEARVPFLDKDLVSLAFSVPDHLKVTNRNTKVLLKRIAGRHLPTDVVHRAKQGFSIPMKNWLHTQFRPLLEDYLNRKTISEQGIFQCDRVAQLKNEHLTGAANHSHLLWSLIVFHAWRRRWYDSQTFSTTP